VNVSAAAEMTVSFPAGFGIFNAQQNGPTLASSISLNTTDNNVTVVSGSAGATSSGGTWLFVSPGIFNTPQTLLVRVDPTGLAPGTYPGSITLSSPSLTGSITINVTLTVSPNITVTATPAAPGPITFTQAFGGGLPAAQKITLASSGAGATYQASITTNVGNWLQVSPASGAASGDITLTVLQNSLPIGAYNDQVTIALQGASTSVLVYNVTLNVTQAQTVSVSPTGGLNFAFQIGGTVPPSQKITVSSTGGPVNITVGTTTVSGGGWLKTDVTTGKTPQDINVSVDPTNLVPNNYSGSITISAPGVLQNPIVIAVSLTVTAAPPPQPLTITSNATNQAGPIAPGELITIKGTNLGPATPSNGVLFKLNSQGGVDPILAGVRVLFNGTAGTPIFVSFGQINVTVPYEVGTFAQVNVVVEFNGIQSSSIQVRIATTAIGLYTLNSTGSGQAAAVNLNGTFNGPPSSTTIPATQGSVVTLYCTGGGQSNPPSTTGSVTGFGTLLRTPGLVTAMVGGATAGVEFIGEAPGLVTGVIQINLRLPAGVTGNALPVVISIDGVANLAGPNGPPTIAVQ
jgi:uncharacterized protein (TIGR03437 family)